ncbi:putative nuclease HARBI1 [Heterodontus francisci]|uniref:putative nuclease HARBI1 n=1 Tax=Heterodontus francisci TaxID=7792 RepID=UPI00355AF12B
MSREVVTNLCAFLNDDLQPMGFNGHSMPVTLNVTAALNFYASASFQGPPGDLYGVTQSAVHCCIREVTYALCRRAGEYVCFMIDPGSQAQRASVSAPSWDSHSYHGAFILRQPQLALFYTELAQMEGWLLGDKGYPLPTWLLTPVRPPTTAAEERYNTSYGATGATIEQAIGMQKVHFRCLHRSDGALQYEPEGVAHIVAVRCALHNYALNRGEALQDEERCEQD